MATPAALEDLTWKDDALDVITHLASTGRPFSSDDLKDRLRPAPDQYITGRVFGIAADRGLITEVGYIRSVHPSRRRSRICQWVGTPQTQSPQLAA